MEMESASLKSEIKDGSNNSPFHGVDVIITTRNRINDLLITIKNCLDIGFHEYQIFITDDASTDGTAATLKTMYPQIRVHVNTKQSGLIHNRNFMMRASTAEFIFSLDDDSNLMSAADLLEALALLNSKAEYGIFGFIPIEQLEIPPPKNSYPDEIFISKFYIGCGHIIKRSTLELVGFYREEYIFYGEEIDFVIRCFKQGLYAVCKKNLIVHHRVDYKARNSNINANKNKGEYGILWRSELAMANKLTHILINYPSVVIPFYFSKSLYGYFANYIIKNGWYGCYKRALGRVAKRARYIKEERNPLSLKQFKKYISLPG